MPTILADNAGLDSSDLVARLRAAHYEGKSDSGLGMHKHNSNPSQLTCGADLFEGTIASMKKLGVTESYKLKRQVVLSASEASEMVLRVDNVLRATPVSQWRYASVILRLTSRSLSAEEGRALMIEANRVCKASRYPPMKLCIRH